MPSSSIESYCTFTLASDVTAGGLPSEDEIAKDLESSDDNVRVASWLVSIDTKSRIRLSIVPFNSVYLLQLSLSFLLALFLWSNFDIIFVPS